MKTSRARASSRQVASKVSSVTRAPGFTLVEVMVALAVVAVALPALLTTLYQQADDTAYLRDKSLARMVAANKLQELRLGVAQSGQIRASKENGTSRMADRDWFWWVEIVNSPDVPQIYRVDIRVGESAENPQQSLYTLSGFISGDRREDTSAAANTPDGDQDDSQNGDQNGNQNTDPSPNAPDFGSNIPNGLGQELIDALENAGER